MTLVPNETEKALNRQHDVYAAARIEQLEAALEWALDNAGTDHPHYPYRVADAWAYPYLVSNAGGFGGGVGEKYFATALEAVERAALGEKP